MKPSEKVRRYYNRHVDDEDKRLDNHPFELPVTLHFIGKYLNPGEQIFDTAGGTGRIAGNLMDKGYKVGLNDLSENNVKLSKERLENNPNLLFCRQADALTSDDWRNREWDAVLLLGPLYHLTTREKRLELLRLAAGSVRKGGYVFSSFMTRTGALIYGLKQNPEGILFKDGVNKLWAEGTDKDFVMDTEWFTNAYFSHPEEVRPLMEEAGLEQLHLAGAEGIFGERFELYHRLNDELKKNWLKFIVENCEEPHMVHHSKHLLCVARKK